MKRIVGCWRDREVGTFAEPKLPSPAFSVYEERKHAWVSLPENIEHLAW